MAVAQLREPVTHFADSVLELPLARLVPAEDNPRRDLGDITELAMSIKSVGLLEPILATPRDPAAGTYTVVAGHRRLAAAELAGLEYVPVYVKELTDQERLAAMLVENLQRSDLQPLEEAAAFRRLVDEFGMTQRQLSEKVGRSQGHVSKRLALLDLPETVQAKIDSGGITVADAVELSKLKDHPERIEEVLARPFYMDFADALNRALGAVKEEELLVAREEQLESNAVATVRVTTRHHLPAKIHRLKEANADGYDPHALQITTKEHEKHQCHAIALYVAGGEVQEFPVCTDRKQHPKVKTKQETARGRHDSNSSNADEQRAALGAAKKARQQFILDLYAKKNPFTKPDSVRLAALHLIANIGWSYTDLVSRAVGIAPEFDLSEETVARVGVAGGGPIHVVTDETESDAGATKVDTLCGAAGMGQGIDRPGTRKRPVDQSKLCTDCAAQLADVDSEELVEALVAAAWKSEAEALRIATLIALLENDGQLSSFSPWGGQDVEHLKQLQKLGYDPTPAELAKLEEATS